MSQANVIYVLGFLVSAFPVIRIIREKKIVWENILTFIAGITLLYFSITKNNIDEAKSLQVEKRESLQKRNIDSLLFLSNDLKATLLKFGFRQIGDDWTKAAVAVQSAVVTKSTMPVIQQNKNGNNTVISQKVSDHATGFQNTGTNYGTQVAGNNNTTNYGIVPRIINSAKFNDFIKMVPDKDNILAVSFLGQPNGEMLDVKRQIIKILRGMGYTRVSDKSNIYFSDPNSIDDIYIDKNTNGSVEIVVQPANKINL